MSATPSAAGLDPRTRLLLEVCCTPSLAGARCLPWALRAGAVALLLYYLAGTAALAAYLWSSRSLLKPSFKNARLRWPLFAGILRVGLVGSISTVATNLSIGVATSLAGGFGPAAIAGYGTASRLEYLLVPLVFGLGAPLVAMVGSGPA